METNEEFSAEDLLEIIRDCEARLRRGFRGDRPTMKGADVEYDASKKSWEACVTNFIRLCQRRLGELMHIVLILCALSTQIAYAAPKKFDIRVVVAKNVPASADMVNRVFGEVQTRFQNSFGLDLTLRSIKYDMLEGDEARRDLSNFYNGNRYNLWYNKYANGLKRKHFTSVWLAPFTGDGRAWYAGQATQGANLFNGVSMINPIIGQDSRTALLMAHELAHNFGAGHLDRINVMHPNAQTVCYPNYAGCPFFSLTRTEIRHWIELTARVRRRCLFQIHQGISNPFQCSNFWY